MLPGSLIQQIHVESRQKKQTSNDYSNLHSETTKSDLTVKIQNRGQTHSEVWSKGGCSVQFHTVKPFT